MSDVSEESLLDYFYAAGGNSGRVRNADMLKTFKPFIGHADPQLRGKYSGCSVLSKVCSCPSQGEKYLILKKKYRHLLQERQNNHRGTDGEQQNHLSLARTSATAHWETTDPPTASPHLKEQQDEPMACGEPDAEVRLGLTSVEYLGGRHRSSVCVCVCVCVCLCHAMGTSKTDLFQLTCVTLSAFLSPLSNTLVLFVFQSESEHDEECTGSVGSTAVALDPIEKEWIYSAASARVPDLLQLLTQDPLLANKKVTALHWAAKHGNKDMAALVADAGADVNTKSGYTPLHIAALHGHLHILDLLVGTYGAKENLRDYSGHFPSHYLSIKEPEGPGEDFELQFHVTQARERNKNRKLASLFQSKKKWGSAEELAPIEEERVGSHQLSVPAFRPRKFSR
uniref:SOWAHA-C winged helix-turn-helix domain-containing protein n=2 Tax=Nothobranchius TaxID=28779 RepID=A0A8C6KVC9_NOTFU